jgi:alkanesulfonate monooxygenase SsuD/methylene tetrahydromethanopterin reductase-like flavin-dependent oxidoreductase (luciferase family)
MAAELRRRRPGSRVVLRVGVYFEREPRKRGDERGRHALAGPSEWVAAQLRKYVDAGADGFVLNLDHPGAWARRAAGRFAEEVIPLIRR